MKREAAIKIAIELGWEYDDHEDHIYYCGEPCTSMLTVFARHVEQATLERAAEECERTFFGNAGELNHEIAEAIRALKDSHD